MGAGIRLRASDFNRIINHNKYDRYVCTLYLVPVDILVVTRSSLVFANSEPTPTDSLVPPLRGVSTACNVIFGLESSIRG